MRLPLEKLFLIHGIFSCQTAAGLKEKSSLEFHDFMEFPCFPCLSYNIDNNKNSKDPSPKYQQITA
jgi:hypothetical protein